MVHSIPVSGQDFNLLFTGGFTQTSRYYNWRPTMLKCKESPVILEFEV